MRLLWDASAEGLSPTSDLVLERVLEYGDIGDIRWLFHTVPHPLIESSLERKGRRRLSPRTLNFWRRYFGVKKDSSENPAEGTADALGETRWR